MTIAQNAGVDAAAVVAKVEQQEGDFGYDALNDEFVNLFERGIIDPTKVRVYSQNLITIGTLSFKALHNYFNYSK